jgi:hypothetical protein
MVEMNITALRFRLKVYAFDVEHPNLIVYGLCKYSKYREI